MSHQGALQKNMITTNLQHSNVALVATMTTVAVSVDVDVATNVRRRPRILLGVTGSVAAVKAPELALKLVNELNAQVKVLLTQGGDNFWHKTRDYDPKNWQILQEAIHKEPSASSLIHVIGEYSTTNLNAVLI